MAAAKKVRVYDLAKDLKQDAKRVIEDLRRECRARDPDDLEAVITNAGGHA